MFSAASGLDAESDISSKTASIIIMLMISMPYIDLLSSFWLSKKKKKDNHYSLSLVSVRSWWIAAQKSKSLQFSMVSIMKILYVLYTHIYPAIVSSLCGYSTVLNIECGSFRNFHDFCVLISLNYDPTILVNFSKNSDPSPINYYPSRHLP